MIFGIGPDFAILKIDYITTRHSKIKILYLRCNKVRNAYLNLKQLKKLRLQQSALYLAGSCSIEISAAKFWPEVCSIQCSGDSAKLLRPRCRSPAQHICIPHILFTFLAKNSFFTIFRGASGHQLCGAAVTPVFGTMGVTRPSNAVIIFAVTPHFSPLLTTLTNDFFQCPAQTRPPSAANRSIGSTTGFHNHREGPY